MSLHEKLRAQIGKNLKEAIEKKSTENALRKIDALTGKDHSWIGKVFNGKMNLTIDSFLTFILAYQLDPKLIFDINIDYTEFSEQELWEYLISIRKKKPRKRATAKNKVVKKKTINKSGK